MMTDRQKNKAEEEDPVLASMVNKVPRGVSGGGGI